MKFIKPIIIAIMAIQISAYHASAKDQKNALRQTLSINDVIKRSNFACSPKQELIDIYHSLWDIHDGSKLPKLDSQTVALGDIRLTDVKKISRSTREKNGMHDTYVALDIDAFVGDIHVLRFANFGLDDIDDGTESAGFYHIVKGSPAAVKKKLIRRGVDLNNIWLQKTVGNNTRIRCTMAG